MYFYRVEWRDSLSPIDLNYATTLENAIVFAHSLIQEHQNWGIKHSKVSGPIEVWIWKEILDDPDYECGRMILKLDESGEEVWRNSEEKEVEDS